MRYLSRRIVFVLGLSILVGVGSLWAQTDRGTITGTVTDPSGGVIVGASVAATNTGTGVTTKTTSSSAGIYTIPFLKVGRYEVTVEQTGFKKFVQTGIVLEVGQTVRVDAQLALGLATQTIEVTAQAAQIQRDTSDRGTVVTSRDVEELPIVSQSEARNPGFYMTLAPGVTGRGTANTTSSGSGRQLNTTVNGSPSGSTEFHLDGAVIGQGYMMAGDFHLLPFPPEAVGEFRVMTLDPPAEFGQTGLGITSFSIKSGSNQLHGSAYEMVRNEKLDAISFFTNSAAPGCDAQGHKVASGGVKACPTLNKQNEFGVTVGGPVVIPKVYNGKDKTFFFGWYHGYRLAQEGGSTAKDTLPTARMKAGDFSNIPNRIMDPTKTPRQQFPGNIIPSGSIDPVSAKIFSYFPDPPSCPTCYLGYVDNWIGKYMVRSTINQWGTKIDHAISDKHRIMGEFIWWKNYAPTGSKWPGAISEGANSTIQQDIARFAHDWFIRPNLVNHWVVGYNRYRSDTFPQSGLGWPGKLGYSGVPQSGPGSTFVEMDIGGLGNTYARGGQGYGATNNFTFGEDLTWTKGRHTIKTGFNYIKMQANAFSSTYQSSYLTFNAGTTSALDSTYNDGCSPGTSGCTGLGAAGFLLGLVSKGTTGVTGAVAADRMGRYAGYVQDDFKATSKLTLNIGLRYDLILPTVNQRNQYSWMDPLAINPAIGIKGALFFATPSRRAAASTFMKAFGPRIGLAYALNPRTVVRAGYGILYTAGGAQRSLTASSEQLGYNASQSVNEDASIAGYIGALPGTVAGHSEYHMTLKNGWPSSLFTPPPFIDPGYMNGAGPPAFGSFPGDGNLPYIQNWHVSVQRQIPGQILLDVAYVGTKGTHLPSRLMNTNATPTKYLTQPDFLYTVMMNGHPDVRNRLFDPIADPGVQALAAVQTMPVDPTTGHHSPFKGFEALGSTTLAQALRPYPQYTTDTVEGLSQLRDFGEVVGVSTYHALQIQARKHFSQGLSFLVSYTWSKTLSDAESMFNEFSGFTQDFYNRKAEKAVSINDYPSNLVLAYEYQLPLGPGKKFANVHGPMGKVIGGWIIAGVQQYQSGPPQLLMTGSNAFNPYTGPNSFLVRPNNVPGVPKKSAAILNGTWNPNGQGAAGAVYNISAWCDPQLPTAVLDANGNLVANPGAACPGPLSLRTSQNYTLGNAPRTDSAVRRFPYLNEDISLIKRTNITERVNIEFRADFLNIFNRTLFGFDQGGDQYGSVIQGMAVDWGSGSFGHTTAQANFPREIQFGLKINY